MRRLADVTRAHRQPILDLVCPELVPIVAERNVCFLREVNFIIQYPHYLFLPNYVLGSNMAGWALHVPTLRPRTRPPDCPVGDLYHDLDVHNAAVLHRVHSTRDASLDEASWAKSLKEFEAGSLLGPWYSTDAIPFQTFRLVPRFPI